MKRITHIDQKKEKGESDKTAKIYSAVAFGFSGLFILAFVFGFLFSKNVEVKFVN